MTANMGNIVTSSEKVSINNETIPEEAQVNNILAEAPPVEITNESFDR